MDITIGDANVIGARHEARFLREPRPGEIIWVHVPAGFWWTIVLPDRIIVEPRWWRRLKHRLTGRW